MTTANATDIDPGIVEAFEFLQSLQAIDAPTPTPPVSLGIFDDHPHPVDEVLERMTAAGVAISDDAKERIRAAIKKKMAVRRGATRGLPPAT